MGNWFSKRLESLIDKIIFAAICGGGLAVWGIIQKLDLRIILVIVLFSIALILLILRLVQWLIKKRKTKTNDSAQLQIVENRKDTIEFYRTRDELNYGRKTLPTELKGTSRVWAAWWTGISPKSQGVLKIRRNPPIDKIILTDPYGGYLPYLAKIDEKEDEIEDLRNEIIACGGKCKKLKCTVKYFDGAIEGIIIADYDYTNDENQFSDKAWIRVEVMIPYTDRENACNFVVYNKKTEEDERDIVLFKALVEHYKFIWKLSTDEPTPKEKMIIATTNTEAKNKVDQLVKEGERFKRLMQTPEFDNKRLELYIQQWLNKIPEELDKVISHHASIIATESADLITNEKLQYSNWQTNEALLRIVVVHKLELLRKIRSLL